MASTGSSVLFREQLSVGASGGRVKFTCISAARQWVLAG